MPARILRAGISKHVNLLQIFLQQIHFVKFLPREVEIVAAEVSVSCGSLVDWAAQVEHLDDAGWTQVEVLTDDID